MSDRPCVVGTCRCGGYGVVYDEEAEREMGVCHDEIPDSPLTPEERAFEERARRIMAEAPDPPCCWCYSEALVGNREDAGRPLTDEEAEAGFWCTHTECREKLDAMLADLATKGVFVEVSDADE